MVAASNSPGFRRTLIVIALLAIAAGTRPAAQQTRPMTFLDMQQMKNAGSPAPSPNGQWMLYTVSTPDWQAAERQSDIYLVSMTTGVSSTKQADVHDVEERDRACVAA
jgi:hypothetical protein